jgi:hypothetical protein
MEMMNLSPEINELRTIILSSQLTTYFLILEELGLKKDKTYHYEQFRQEWMETYKNIYKMIARMKPRKSSRESE